MNKEPPTFTTWLKGSLFNEPGRYVAQAMEADPNLEQAIELAFRQYMAHRSIYQMRSEEK